MGRKRTFPPLDVLMNGRLVGHLSKEASGAIGFAYATEWLEADTGLPVSLSLPLRERGYTGQAVTAVFDNLLPDAEPIRRRVAERVGAASTDTYSLLSEIGRDCVGALQLLPEGTEPEMADGLDGELMAEEAIASLLRRLKTAPLGLDRSEDDAFRISVAGAQEKTALLKIGDDWIRPRGTTPTTHILKPPIGTLESGIDLRHSVENEHVCLRLLGAMDFDVAETEIASFGSAKALVIRRFDRRRTKDGRLLRLPQEDCCQALGVPPTRKYQSEGGPDVPTIMRLLQGSDSPQKDRRDFFAVQVAFWLLGATDGHAKNFSVFLRPHGSYVSTPLYDVLTAAPALASRQLNWNSYKLAMSIGASRHYRVRSILPRHFVETASESGLSRDEASAILASVATLFGTALGVVADQCSSAEERVVLDAIVEDSHSRLRLLEQAN
ncbi:type II toxin-antitoxin system HipA family toxin [Parvularcula oceani]|uniref:type II toxin-antitoxin system HipA family toxin n=1 Tax=Parvularcula oceani TaxID=1247963 RepID=UPI00068B3D03|nr:type II toxin-antitoxin system HipA family toxin [Parvularcula oceani]